MSGQILPAEPADRETAAREYERDHLPIGARAVRMGKLDGAPAVQAAAQRRILRAECAEIEARKKAEFEEIGRRLFGCGFTARHARPKG